MSGYVRKKVKKEDGLWLLSFTDLCLTLLACFVLLVSTMEPRKKNNVLDQMSKKEQKALTINEKDYHLNKVAGEVVRMIDSKNIGNDAQVTKLPQGIYIEFKDNVFFEIGSSKIKDSNALLTDQVLSTIAKIGRDFQIVIEGHTDDRSYATKDNWNWDLSSARGIRLLRKFLTLGVPEANISIVAYAHTRPKVEYKFLSGDALEKARAENRRVAVWLKMPIDLSAKDMGAKGG